MSRTSENDIKFISAAKRGNIEEMERLRTDHKINVFFMDEKNGNAYMHACKKGHFEVIQYLENMTDTSYYSSSRQLLLSINAKNPKKKIKCDINIVKSLNGNNAFLLAVSGGNLDLVKYLFVRYTIDKKTKNNNGEDALIISIRFNHMNIANYLINVKKWDLGTTNDIGSNIYLYACVQGNLEMVKHLLEEKMFDIDSKNDKGWDGVFYTAISGNMDLLKYLLKNGIKYNKNNNFAAISAKRGYFQMVKYFVDNNIGNLFQKYNNSNLFLLAIESGNFKLVKFVEKIPGMISFRGIFFKDDRNTDMLISCARAKSHSVKMIEYLLEKYNCDLHYKNKHGCGVYLIAVANGNVKMMKHLERKYKWDTKITNENGDGDFALAKLNKRKNIIIHIKKRNIKKYFIPERDNINKTCYICHDKFNSDEYCVSCENTHYIHEECYNEYLFNDMGDDVIDVQETKCVYCNGQMLKQKFFYTS